MHISKIEIENYRNFKHLVLSGMPATVVFVGENGIGKSNLLNALRLVLDPGLPDSRTPPGCSAAKIFGTGWTAMSTANRFG